MLLGEWKGPKPQTMHTSYLRHDCMSLYLSYFDYSIGENGSSVKLRARSDLEWEFLCMGWRLKNIHSFLHAHQTPGPSLVIPWSVSTELHAGPCTDSNMGDK